MLISAGQLPDALEALQLALRLEENSGGKRAQGESHMNIGLVLHDLGRHVEVCPVTPGERIWASGGLEWGFVALPPAHFPP